MKHKHYDLIEEWARTGKQVQFYSRTKRWIDVVDNKPCWSEDDTYRIKPEVIRYRRFIYTDDAGEKAIGVLNGASYYENPALFVGSFPYPFNKWLDEEWQEVEV